MTPYSPAAIAREAAERAFPSSFDHGQAPGWPDSMRRDCEQIILTAAARIVRESGAVEALEKIAWSCKPINSDDHVKVAREALGAMRQLLK